MGSRAQRLGVDLGKLVCMFASAVVPAHKPLKCLGLASGCLLLEGRLSDGVALEYEFFSPLMFSPKILSPLATPG